MTDLEHDHAVHPTEHFIRRGQGFDATRALFYEAPLEDPAYLEVFCYTDRISYRPGEVVAFHTSTTARSFTLSVERDGAKPRPVHEATLPGVLHRTAADFYAKGCGWPVSHRWRLPDDLPSGFYIVTVRARDDRGVVREGEHGFFVRGATGDARAPILLLGATCTWSAYNDWGGINAYLGHHPPPGLTFAPTLHLHRPFARGFVRVPVGAPRKPHRLRMAIGAVPRYPPIEFAFARGLSKWYSNAGWATYERPFAVWAEANGFAIDYASQTDLDADPDLLSRYRCVVMVGHDEYWTWEQREAVERYVDNGGRVARFAGNFCWQIRLEEDGLLQVNYKEFARSHDPVMGTARERRLTSSWGDPIVDKSPIETFGLHFGYGIYAHVGGITPRSAGGFTVYRPEHWAFAASDLYYGDHFGGDSKICGYEVDGLDYTFRDGLPFPANPGEVPAGLEILAVAPAGNHEADHGHRDFLSYYPDGGPGMAFARYGRVDPQTLGAGRRGSGMVVHFTRGRGEVFHAGTCEWVAGLQDRDEHVEAITRTVLERYTT